MVFNATLNNISAISWQSVLLVKETWVPRENHWPEHCKSLTNFITLLFRFHLAMSGIQTHNISTLVTGTDCTGSCKSNNQVYYTIMMTPNNKKMTHMCHTFCALSHIKFQFAVVNLIIIRSLTCSPLLIMMSLKAGCLRFLLAIVLSLSAIFQRCSLNLNGH